MNGKTLDKVRNIVRGDPRIAMWMAHLARLVRFDEIVDYMHARGYKGDDFLQVLLIENKGNHLNMASKILAIIDKRNSQEKIILHKDWR